jgi:hypothetical protein
VRFGTLEERMGYVRKTGLAAVVLAAVAAAPAQAGQVIVVDGDRVERVDDPAAPSRAEIELPPPARTRTSAAGARARASSVRGRRAVFAALSTELRRKRIKGAEYRRWRRTYVRSIRTLRRLRGARATQLGYVLGSVESLALRRRRGATPKPGGVLQHERNPQ